MQDQVGRNEVENMPQLMPAANHARYELYECSGSRGLSSKAGSHHLGSFKELLRLLHVQARKEFGGGKEVRQFRSRTAQAFVLTLCNQR